MEDLRESGGKKASFQRAVLCFLATRIILTSVLIFIASFASFATPVSLSECAFSLAWLKETVTN